MSDVRPGRRKAGVTGPQTVRLTFFLTAAEYIRGAIAEQLSIDELDRGSP